MSSQAKPVEGNEAGTHAAVFPTVNLGQIPKNGKITVAQVIGSNGNTCTTEICTNDHPSATNDSAVSTRNSSKTMKIWAEVLKFVGGIFSSVGAPTATLVASLITAGILLGPVVAKIAIASFIVAVLGIVTLGISVLLEKLEPILYPKKA